MSDFVIIFCAQYLYITTLIISGVFFLYQPRATQKRILLLALVALPLIGLTAFIGNHLYNDPRPFVFTHTTPLIPHAADNGFPSDHTLLTASAAILVYFFNKRLGLVLWVICILVGIARIYAGLHHPIDIVGSMLISVVVATSVMKLVDSKNKS